MWLVYALLAAFFASLTAILAKIGIQGVNSNLATAIRTVAVLVMAWGIVLVTGKHAEIPDITRKSWLFLALSGVATGMSWLFYYKALQTGEVSKVVPVEKLSLVLTMLMAFVILGEQLNAKSIIASVLIIIGIIILAL